MSEGSIRARTTRLPVLAAVASVAGIAIAWLDSRPGFDATGITVVSLAVASAAIGFVAGRSPWLWARLVGAPTPLLEVPASRDAGPLAALAVAAVGALAGWAARRLPDEAS
jgi:hypothetical protein